MRQSHPPGLVVEPGFVDPYDRRVACPSPILIVAEVVEVFGVEAPEPRRLPSLKWTRHPGQDERR